MYTVGIEEGLVDVASGAGGVMACAVGKTEERERKKLSLLAITVACLMNHSNVNSWKRLLVSLQFENKRWLRIRIQMFTCVSEGSCHL